MACDDLSGSKFGSLVVLRREVNAKDGSSRWLCECECGQIRIINGTALRAGRNKSCGCKSPKFKAGDPRNAGFSHLREYRIWRGMIDRCSSRRKHKSHLYFGKGIGVSGRWKLFQNFLEDMGKCPPGFTIERIDGNVGYDYSNCRWASKKDQANNTTRNRRLTFSGETMTIAQWAERIGIKPNTLVYRIKRGWTTARALTR